VLIAYRKGMNRVQILYSVTRTLDSSSSLLILRKWLLSSQYRKGFQKLLLRANHVIMKSRNGGTWRREQPIIKWN